MRETEEVAGEGQESHQTDMTLRKRLGKNNLDCQAKKDSVRPLLSLEPKSAVSGILHLSTIGLT